MRILLHVLKALETHSCGFKGDRCPVSRRDGPHPPGPAPQEMGKCLQGTQQLRPEGLSGVREPSLLGKVVWGVLLKLPVSCEAAG